MRAAALLIAMIFSGIAFSQEAVVTLRSTVKGNQEQPKVMYIVPWQRPGDSGLEYQPMDNVASDLFTPVDRDEFIRELQYRDMLGTTGLVNE